MESRSTEGSHNTVAQDDPDHQLRAGSHREKRWRAPADASARALKKVRNVNEKAREEQAADEHLRLISSHEAPAEAQARDVAAEGWNNCPPASGLTTLEHHYNPEEEGATRTLRHGVAQQSIEREELTSSVKISPHHHHHHHQASPQQGLPEWYDYPGKDTELVGAPAPFPSNAPSHPDGLPSGSLLPATASRPFAPYDQHEARQPSAALNPSSTWGFAPGPSYTFAPSMNPPSMNHQSLLPASAPPLPHSVQHVGSYHEELASPNALVHHPEMQSPIAPSRSASATEIVPTYASQQTYTTTQPPGHLVYYGTLNAPVALFPEQNVHMSPYSSPQTESHAFAPHYMPLANAPATTTLGEFQQTRPASSQVGGDGPSTSHLHSTMYGQDTSIDPGLDPHYRYEGAVAHGGVMPPALPENSHVEHGEVDLNLRASVSTVQSLTNAPRPERGHSGGLPPLRADAPAPVQNVPYVGIMQTSPELESEQGQRKKRGQFSEERRKETSDTRAMGACVRCRMQKTRCLPNPDDPDDVKAPCQTCKDLLWTSKKIVHAIPCTRDKLTSIIVYRAGKLYLTERFDENMMVNITDYPGPEPTKTIQVSLGLCRQHVKFEVRRFVPKTTDVTWREYRDPRTGHPQRQELAHYCLADIEKSAAAFRDYFHRHAFDGLKDVVVSEPLVRETFDMIDRYYRSLPDKVEGSKGKLVVNDEKQLLSKAVCLWFATRHTTGSATIEGPETLGMERPPNPNYPLKNSGISLPRMISAQCDSIQHSRIMKILKPEVLKQLESMIRSHRMSCWFTVYLVIFLFLHQISHISIDRRRWAHDNGLGMETYYGPRDGKYSGLTKFVESMQESAWTLLVHWHYYKRTDLDLMNFDWDRREGKSVEYLEPEQIEFMRRSASLLRPQLHEISTRPNPYCWDHGLFFVSKMFSKKFDHLKTFSLS